MRRIGKQVHIDTDDARAGSTPHILRWMLGVSLALSILCLAAIMIWKLAG